MADKITMDKNSTTFQIYKFITEKRSDAINHAKRLNQLHERNHVELLSTDSNPSTQVFKLVEYILETIRKNQANQ